MMSNQESLFLEARAEVNSLQSFILKDFVVTEPTLHSREWVGNVAEQEIETSDAFCYFISAICLKFP